MTLTRSTSCDESSLRRCWSDDSRLRRTGSFTTPLSRQNTAAPKCPGAATKSTGTEWARLSAGLKVAFLRSCTITPEHPAGDCLEAINCSKLRDELFSMGQWTPSAYTRTLLHDGGSYNVMLLNWAPGCTSPVHGHSCADTMVASNCSPSR
jgi:hypothetical protein